MPTVSTKWTLLLLPSQPSFPSHRLAALNGRTWKTSLLGACTLNQVCGYYQIVSVRLFSYLSWPNETLFTSSIVTERTYSNKVWSIKRNKRLTQCVNTILICFQPRTVWHKNLSVAGIPKGRFLGYENAYKDVPTKAFKLANTVKTCN